ncbi:hypothetical protein BUBS_57 [Bacillus phage Bubs]|uniref:hypothetical protein n=1 Tax=Bacillus phage Nemo TaxID=1805950 RepID=UPI0007A7759F|nr:hypothetical protein BI006_gp057 [Bacillus phage Nemo]AMW63534.1 hypothetical protein NEMO_57 [Bacillus phage Nemo]ASR78702.1 hypothetical protein BUBS_57 [Bacillus phage Bubs]ULF49262.1 hypothetical protein [Bacillus phage MrBubbles]
MIVNARVFVTDRSLEGWTDTFKASSASAVIHKAQVYYNRDVVYFKDFGKFVRVELDKRGWENNAH